MDLIGVFKVRDAWPSWDMTQHCVMIILYDSVPHKNKIRAATVILRT